MLLNLVLVEKERALENKVHSKKEPRTDPWGRNLLKKKKKKERKKEMLFPLPIIIGQIKDEIRRSKSTGCVYNLPVNTCQCSRLHYEVLSLLTATHCLSLKIT